MSRQRKALKYIILITVIYGSTFVALKVLLAELTPWLLVAARFGAAGVVVGAAALIKGVRFGRGVWGRGVLLGLVLMAGYGLQTLGLVSSGAGKSAFITALYVVFTPFAAALLTKRRLNRRVLGAALAALAGVYLLANPRGLPAVGDLYTLGCAAAFALHLALIDRYAREGEELQLTTVQLLVVGLLAAALTLLFEEPSLELSGLGWGLLAYLAFAATALVVLLQMYWQPALGAGPAAVVYVGEAVVAWLGGILLLEESFAWSGYAGALLIIGAVLLAVVPRKRPPSEIGLPPDPGGGR